MTGAKGAISGISEGKKENRDRRCNAPKKIGKGMVGITESIN